MARITTNDLFNIDGGYTMRLEIIRAIKSFKKIRIRGKVKSSAYAIGNGVVKKETFGNFVGFSRDSAQIIKVIKKGNKTLSFYNILFWLPIIKDKK